jgi:hypothetical protein
MSAAAYREMESVINASAVLCKLRMGSKRTASRVLPIDQSLSKRRHISRRIIDHQPLRDEPSAQGSTIEAADRNKAV